MPSGKGAGTKPIHNKAPKSKGQKNKDEDEDPADAEFRRKQMEDRKAAKELAAKAGGRGPLNTGQQGIKKSGRQ